MDPPGRSAKPVETGTRDCLRFRNALFRARQVENWQPNREPCP